jgi:hypothetical protein
MEKAGLKPSHLKIEGAQGGPGGMLKLIKDQKRNRFVKEVPNGTDGNTTFKARGIEELINDFKMSSKGTNDAIEKDEYDLDMELADIQAKVFRLEQENRDIGLDFDADDSDDGKENLKKVSNVFCEPEKNLLEKKNFMGIAEGGAKKCAFDYNQLVADANKILSSDPGKPKGPKKRGLSMTNH